MSLLIKGITKLSEMDIDADKDWHEFGITNLKQITDNMSKGDLAVKETGILVKIQPGGDGLVLTSQGPGKIPVWAPKGGNFKYYFPVTVALANAEAKVTVDRSNNINTPMATWHRENYLDDVPSWIKRLTPTVALVDGESAVAVDRSKNTNVPITRQWGLKMLVDGALADDGGVQTDETAAARSPTIDDMSLLPAAPAANDAYYFGWNYKFDWMWLNISTAGVGNWALIEEYWNGAAWTPCVDPVDRTTQFMAGGLRRFSHTPQADWAATAVAGLTWYWIRYRVTNFVNISTQPKGAQSWCEKVG